MHVRAPLVADEQSLEVVQVGEGTFHHPAHATQSRPVPGLPASDQRCDAQLAQRIAVTVGVVATIADDARGATARMTDSARNRRDGRDEGKQLLDVVAVGARQAPGERDARGVDEKVVL